MVNRVITLSDIKYFIKKCSLCIFHSSFPTGACNRKINDPGFRSRSTDKHTRWIISQHVTQALCQFPNLFKKKKIPQREKRFLSTLSENISLYLLYFCQRKLLWHGWEGVVSVIRVREWLRARKELIFDCPLSNSSARLHRHVTSAVVQGFAFGRVLCLVYSWWSPF